MNDDIQPVLGGSGNSILSPWFGPIGQFIPSGFVVVLPAGVYDLDSDNVSPPIHLLSGAIVNTNGFELWVDGTMTIDAGAEIRNRGNPGVIFSGGGPQPPVPNVSSLKVAGLPGGSGANAIVPPTDGAGLTGTNVFFSNFNATLNGGAGGNGGDGSVVAGGLGGSNAGIPQKQLGETFTIPRLAQRSWVLDPDTGIYTYVYGGCGGGGGGNDGVNFDAGGGGGGGSQIKIWALRMINNGLIDASGGNGADAVDADCGGGGGGGGGLIYLFVKTYTGTGSLNVNGGLGGQGGPGGNPGQNGSPGQSFIFRIA